MDKSPLSALLPRHPHFLGKPASMVSPCPPPRTLHSHTRILWVWYLLCSDGHRGWGKAGGRLRTFFVLLFRSFFVLPTLQKK